MTATVFYDDQNEIALLANTFLNISLVPADPTTVTCKVTEPSGSSILHTYLGAAPSDITRLSTGKYQLQVQCSPVTAGVDGLWTAEWTGAGAVSDVQPVTWRVWAPDQNRWYVGPEELKDRLGMGSDTTQDAQIVLACRSASRWIERFTGRHFYRVTDTRTFQPLNIWLLPVDDLVSVTQLAVDNDGDHVFEQVWVEGTDFQLRVADEQYNTSAYGEPVPYTQVQVVSGVNGGGAKWFPFIWPFTHLDRVQITGVWGWPAVPTLITEAAQLIAADWFKMKDAPWGVAGISDLGTVRTNPNPWLVEQLRPYVRGRRKVGV